MTYEEERQKLIEEDQEIVSFPPPDYSKMTNEQIKQRTKMIKSTFEFAFSEEDTDEDL
nr:hypothetical protein [Priestia megaterium]